MYKSLYNLYMALHIADNEVSELVTRYAQHEGLSKTEALRRLLRRAIVEQTRQERQKYFRDFALKLVAEGRRKKLKPVTKAEIDALYEGIEP